MNLFVVIGTPLAMLILGIALEAGLMISYKQGGELKTYMWLLID
jgi:hypothetical protein